MALRAHGAVLNGKGRCEHKGYNQLKSRSELPTPYTPGPKPYDRQPVYTHPRQGVSRRRASLTTPPRMSIQLVYASPLSPEERPGSRRAWVRREDWGRRNG